MEDLKQHLNNANKGEGGKKEVNRDRETELWSP